MAAENLADLIGALTQEEQESVRRFIDFLKGKDAAPLRSSSINTLNCSAVWLSDVVFRRATHPRSGRARYGVEAFTFF